MPARNSIALFSRLRSRRGGARGVLGVAALGLSWPAVAVADPQPDAAPTVEVAASAGEDTVAPPRVDGTYVGGVATAGGSLIRVNDLDTPSVFWGQMGGIQLGQTVLPWLGLGFSLSGGSGFAPSQKVNFGALRADILLLPVPHHPLSLRLGFGLGAGAVHDDREEGRFGFGGPSFQGAVRYEFFPWAARKRRDRAGGFCLGPELGWIGHTPAAVGRPMVNTFYLGLWTGFYFGH